MSDYAFCGTETTGWLLAGHVSRTQALAAAGTEADFVAADGDRGRCRIALLVVRIQGLRTWRLPFPRWTYPEAVWMLALSGDRYLAVRAHTRPWMVPMLRRMDRYHTHAARLAIAPTAVRVDAAAGGFEAELDGAETTSTSKLISALWTRSSRGRVYQIPWADERPELITTARCRIVRDDLATSVFGPGVVWSGDAIVYRDRPHRCAPAVPTDAPGRHLPTSARQLTTS